jgi:hypothetical protein
MRRLSFVLIGLTSFTWFRQQPRPTEGFNIKAQDVSTIMALL